MLKYFQITRYKTPSEKKLAQSIKNLFGFYPKNIALFEQALTHSSAATKETKSNERLEFLGDSILSTIVAEYLFSILPNKDEGILTQVRSRMVSRSQLNKLAVKLGIDKILQTDIKGNVSFTLYGDALEALVGAIYLDTGFIQTKKIILEIFKRHLEIQTIINEDTDYKSRLINLCQKNKTTLQFVLISENMDGIKKMYHIGIEVNGEIISEAQNASKRVAEQLAAHAALEKLESA
ncbi:MAG TPA: ribonuclease III [Bacteroidia bacterium]|nr:ribonuclease III [Bacteroidia bacterium]